MQDITIATRRYVGLCLRTRTEYPLVDRIARRGRRLFLIEGSEPGGREVVRPISLSYAFEWLRELPEQIERTVIPGGFVV